MSELKLSEEDMEKTRKILLRELKEELSQWAKTRFWFAAIVIGAITIFGVRAVVKEVLEEDLRIVRTKSQEAIVDAKTAGALATEAANKAKIVAESSAKQADSLSGTLEVLRQSSDQTASALDEVGQKIEAAKSSIRTLTTGAVGALGERVRSIEDAVSVLADRVDYRVPSGERFAMAQKDLRKTTEITAQRLENNSQFTVYIQNYPPLRDPESIPKSSKLLMNAGFGVVTQEIDGAIIRGFESRSGIAEGTLDAKNVIVVHSAKYQADAEEIRDILSGLFEDVSLVIRNEEIKQFLLFVPRL